MTTTQLRSALRDAGVTFASNATREVLENLLQRHRNDAARAALVALLEKQKGDTGVSTRAVE
jgi:glutamine phosphoribosylpyrophosphate amidotransferase